MVAVAVGRQTARDVIAQALAALLGVVWGQAVAGFIEELSSER